MAVIGYIRVSLVKQTLEYQHSEIAQFSKKYGLRIDEWVEEFYMSSAQNKFGVVGIEISLHDK